MGNNYSRDRAAGVAAGRQGARRGRLQIGRRLRKSYILVLIRFLFVRFRYLLFVRYNLLFCSYSSHYENE